MWGKRGDHGVIERSTRRATWAVTVEYGGAPIRPYPKNKSGLADARVQLASMTVCGSSQTRITASVTAETEQEAREIGSADIDRLARSLRLPVESGKVTVVERLVAA